MIKTLALPCLLLSVLLMGCRAAPNVHTAEPRMLVVFAAASLTNAFTEIGDKFEAANPGVQITFSFAGSQTLRTQLEAGASADIFASASREEIDYLISANMVAEDEATDFATNRLVVILPASNPAHIQALPDLARSGLKLVLAAGDVPVGRYTREALSSMTATFGADFADRVLGNVVSNEDNVRQVVAKVQLGEADAGIVYSSDAVGSAELRTIMIPPEMNVVARYPVVVLSGSTRAALAQRFVDYVLSADGQAVLKKWGFGPVD